MTRPYTIKRYDRDLGGYPVVFVEQHLNVGGRPTGLRTAHTIGQVDRAGSYGWTAAPAEEGRAPFGGYRTRAEAADVLWDDWRATANREENR